MLGYLFPRFSSSIPGRHHISKMGGGTKFEYPKYVWSPSGGWWCNPRNWKRNTFIAAGVIGAVFVPIVYISWQLERRPVAPYRHIPSQRFSRYSKVDDPSLPDDYQLIKYKK